MISARFIADTYTRLSTKTPLAPLLFFIQATLTLAFGLVAVFIVPPIFSGLGNLTLGILFASASVVSFINTHTALILMAEHASIPKPALLTATISMRCAGLGLLTEVFFYTEAGKAEKWEGLAMFNSLLVDGSTVLFSVIILTYCYIARNRDSSNLIERFQSELHL